MLSYASMDPQGFQHQFFRQAATERCLAKLGGYSPGQKNLFLRAFVHPAFVHEHPRLNLRHYQRLEFLGDAVLELYVTDKIFNLFSDMREGELSLLRSSLICGESLTRLGKFLGLDELILMGKGMSCTSSILGNIFEALVGSIHQDKGFRETQRILDHVFESYQNETGESLLDRHRGERFDYKSRLQEITVKLHGETPQYRHKKINEQCFNVDLWVCGHRLANARKASKKEAEKFLAEKALREKLYQGFQSKGA